MRADMHRTKRVSLASDATADIISAVCTARVNSRPSA